uniref:Uncharacterized protein n=1 Tax=Physcomitrium patens TaxID=3218 RepID=A9T546_PHYPA|nr:hypothetical protein PHYPA_025025 [Physcomitrium patens]
MARRAGKRGGSKMRMAKVAKRRSHVLRQRKPVAVKQQRKRNIKDDDYGSETATARAGDCKGKKIKLDQSDVDTDGDTSLATSLQGFSEETSASPASWSSDSTPGKGNAKHDQKGKRKRKYRKVIKEISVMSSGSQTTTERTSRKSSRKSSPKRRRPSYILEKQTHQSKQSESGKTTDPAATGSTSKKGNHPQVGNDAQKGVPKDAEPKEKATAKEVVDDKHEEESSSSSG